jgi:MATE family multidrug resistance protein
MPVGWGLGIHRGLGAHGMWMGLIAGLTVAAVLLFTRFCRSAWKLRWRLPPLPAGTKTGYA